MTEIHHCHFPLCRAYTPRKLLYCPPHWRMVPAVIQRRVWAAYNALPHGPDGNCLRVSKEYIAAVGAAESAIREKTQEAGWSSAGNEKSASGAASVKL